MPAPSPECTHPAAIIRRGFTILELSITLTIIALLMGGVLAGQTLIRSSELRSVTNQLDQVVSATNSFKEKYHYLPGDIPNATRFWGLAGGANGLTFACRNTESTDAKTCDGDGNGQIYAPLVSQPGPEQVRFWQHLANAGLIQGQYTGAYDAASGLSSINTLSGKIGNSLWSVFAYRTQSGDVNFFDGIYGNSLQFGGFYSGGSPVVAVLTNQEIKVMDEKMDDGLPATGKMFIITYNGFSACTSAADGASSTLTATYLGNDEKKCLTAWRNQF